MRTSQNLGSIPNQSGAPSALEVPSKVLRLGSSAVLAFVATRLTTPVGTTVALMVGAYVGRFALDFVRAAGVVWHATGRVEINVETMY